MLGNAATWMAGKQKPLQRATGRFSQAGAETMEKQFAGIGGQNPFVEQQTPPPAPASGVASEPQPEPVQQPPQPAPVESVGDSASVTPGQAARNEVAASKVGNDQPAPERKRTWRDVFNAAENGTLPANDQLLSRPTIGDKSGSVRITLPSRFEMAAERQRRWANSGRLGGLADAYRNGEEAQRQFDDQIAASRLRTEGAAGYRAARLGQGLRDAGVRRLPNGTLTYGATPSMEADTGMAVGSRRAAEHAAALAAHTGGDIIGGGYSQRQLSSMQAANRAAGFGRSRPIGKRADGLADARERRAFDAQTRRMDWEASVLNRNETKRQFNANMAIEREKLKQSGKTVQADYMAKLWDAAKQNPDIGKKWLDAYNRFNEAAAEEGVGEDVKQMLGGEMGGYNISRILGTVMPPNAAIPSDPAQARAQAQARLIQAIGRVNSPELGAFLTKNQDWILDTALGAAQ